MKKFINKRLAELFLAWRYLRPKRNAVSVITCISVLGVALGVAVLIVVIAVMTGFTDEMKEKILDTMAHLHIVDYRKGYIADPREVVKTVNSLGYRASPVVCRPAIVQIGEHLIQREVVGICPETEKDSVDVSKVVVGGKFSLEKGEILLSSITAKEFNLAVGEKIIVHSQSKLTKMFRFRDGQGFELREDAKFYLPGEFKIAGIFSFGKYDFDVSTLFMNIDDADDLFDLPWGAATAVYVRSDDPFNIEPAKEKVQLAFPKLQVYSWKDRNKPLLGVLAVEKNMMFFLLIFIVIVATFSIATTLITVVLQKTREIGLMKAVGASPFNILAAFVLQGGIVGIVGTICGTTLGIAVVHWRNDIMHFLSSVTGWELFPKKYYFFSELPAHIVAGDLFLICFFSIALCTFGAFLPALRAANLDPAKALRYE